MPLLRETFIDPQDGQVRSRLRAVDDAQMAIPSPDAVSSRERTTGTHQTVRAQEAETAGNPNYQTQANIQQESARTNLFNTAPMQNAMSAPNATQMAMNEQETKDFFVISRYIGDQVLKGAINPDVAAATIQKLGGTLGKSRFPTPSPTLAGKATPTPSGTNAQGQPTSAPTPQGPPTAAPTEAAQAAEVNGQPAWMQGPEGGGVVGGGGGKGWSAPGMGPAPSPTGRTWDEIKAAGDYQSFEERMWFLEQIGKTVDLNTGQVIPLARTQAQGQPQPVAAPTPQAPAAVATPRPGLATGTQGGMQVPDLVHGGTATIPDNALQAIRQLFPEQEFNTAIHIAAAESKGSNDAIGKAGEVGLFQVHPVHFGTVVTLPDGTRVAINAQNLRDPVVNTAAARQIWQNNQGWNPWTTKQGVFAGFAAQGGSQQAPTPLGR